MIGFMTACIFSILFNFEWQNSNCGVVIHPLKMFKIRDVPVMYLTAEAFCLDLAVKLNTALWKENI